MQMTYDREIGEVEIQDNQILFTDKGGTAVYKTGLVQDPGLTERLYTNGAVFSSEIVEEMSPLDELFRGLDSSHDYLHWNRPAFIPPDGEKNGWWQFYDVWYGRQ